MTKGKAMTKGEQTKNAVLSKALSLATQHGLEALTIGLLAKEMGLSKSGLFAHFSSKENLQTAVLEKAAERFSHVLAPAFKAARGEPRVRALFEQALKWCACTDRPGGCVFVKVSNEIGHRPGPVRDVLVEHEKSFFAVVRKAADLAIEEGHFRADLDLEQFAYDFYSYFLSFHHYSTVLGFPGAEERFRKACEQLIDRSRA